ncbi:hypothetical protein PO909_012883 [Leuciscus waleckii]
MARSDPPTGDRPSAASSASVGRTSSAAVHRDRLRFGQEGSGSEGGSGPSGPELYSALPLRLCRSPRGRGQCPPRLPSLGNFPSRPPPPTPPTRASPGPDCSQSESECAARAGTGPRNGRSRSAVMSATHPTRLETRTKESNARASQRVSTSPHGAMKVKAGARRPGWDPLSPEGGAPPARLTRSAGEVERVRARWYPKDGELCLGRAKPEETLVEARSGPDVQIGRPTWV